MGGNKLPAKGVRALPLTGGEDDQGHLPACFFCDCTDLFTECLHKNSQLSL